VGRPTTPNRARPGRSRDSSPRPPRFSARECPPLAKQECGYVTCYVKAQTSPGPFSVLAPSTDVTPTAPCPLSRPLHRPARSRLPPYGADKGMRGRG
jgi:hypothetical protein